MALDPKDAQIALLRQSLTTLMVDVQRVVPLIEDALVDFPLAMLYSPRAALEHAAYVLGQTPTQGTREVELNAAIAGCATVFRDFLHARMPDLLRLPGCIYGPSLEEVIQEMEELDHLTQEAQALAEVQEET